MLFYFWFHNNKHIIGENTVEATKFTEKTIERIDENGTKFIEYEENPIDIDVDAEVNI